MTTLDRGRRWVALGVLGTLVAVVGSLLLTPATSAAEGETIAASRFFPVFGPRLAGEDVLWTVPRRDRGYVMKRRGVESGRPQSIFTMPSRKNRRVSLVWEASPSEVLVQQALVDTAGDDPAGGLAIDLGTARLLPSGGLERLASGAFPNIGNFDLDGSVGVFPGQDSDEVIVRDFGQPSSSTRIANPGLGLEVAGRYVAWVTPAEVVVYDYAAMRETYRLPRPDGGGLSDLQPDGKVALTFKANDGPPPERGLGWASPSEPFLHPLPVPPAPVWAGIELRDDVLVYERSRGSLAQTVRGDLGFVPLGGGEARTLAQSVETAVGTDALFDFDGRRVAWLDRTCARARVHVALLSDLVEKPRGAPSRRCRLRLADRPRVTRQGDLRVRVSCAGFRRDCKVFGATVRLARTYRLGGKRLRRGTRLFVRKRRTGGLSSVGKFKLGRQTRRLLRQPGSVRLRLTVRAGDPEATPKRRVTVTVR